MLVLEKGVLQYRTLESSGMSMTGSNDSWRILNADASISKEEALPTFHPEFGRFMLEATPGEPWGIGFVDLLKVESNMKWRFVSMLVFEDGG